MTISRPSCFENSVDSLTGSVSVTEFPVPVASRVRGVTDELFDSSRESGNVVGSGSLVPFDAFSSDSVVDCGSGCLLGWSSTIAG